MEATVSFLHYYLCIMRNRKIIKLFEAQCGFIVYNKNMQAELLRTECEFEIANYSSKTIKSYLFDLRKYFYFKYKDLIELDQITTLRFSSLILLFDSQLLIELIHYGLTDIVIT